MDRQAIRERQQVMERLWAEEDRTGGADSRPLRQAAATAVSQLSDLVAKVEAASTDDRELGLTLRYLGDAYFTLSGKKDQWALAEARKAYRRAELLLEEGCDPTDLAKLNFNMANTLRAIGDPPDFPYLQEARRRYNQALKVFSIEMPELAPQVQSALQSLEIIAAGVRIYDAAKRSHDRVAGLLERLESAGPAVESHLLNEVLRDFQHLKSTEPEPAALLTGFQDFLTSAAPLLALTEQDDDSLEQANGTLGNLLREFAADSGPECNDQVFDRVFDLLDRAKDSGEVTEARHEALQATLMEFRSLTRKSPRTPEAMASQVTRMRELINRYKPILVNRT